MNVIGHDHVPTDEPAIGLAPHFHQRLMDDGICQVLFAFLRTDSDENNRGLPKKDEHALGRVAALFKRRSAVWRLDSVSPYQIRTRESFTVGRDSVEPFREDIDIHLHHRPKTPDYFLQTFADLA